MYMKATRQRKRHSENPFSHRSIFNYRIQYYYFITDDYMAIYKLLLIQISKGILNVIERQHSNETAKSLLGGLLVYIYYHRFGFKILSRFHTAVSSSAWESFDVGEGIFQGMTKALNLGLATLNFLKSYREI